MPKVGEIYKEQEAIFRIVKIDDFIWYKLYTPNPTVMQSFWSMRDYPINKDFFENLLNTGKISKYEITGEEK